MAALPLGVLTEDRRCQIVRNVFGPVVLLIEAVQLAAAAAGPDEEAVLMQFIGSLHAEAELMKRDQNFQILLEKIAKVRQLSTARKLVQFRTIGRVLP